MNYMQSKRCEAHVTLKKSRLKEYNNRSVYLKDGQEFEIELFNPHQKSVLAKIFINGIAISGGGIVLRPGQRVFLERYLDVDRKFKFSTYEVENTGAAKEAIAKNGDVEVKFFYEQEPPMWYGGSTITISNGWTQDWQSKPDYTLRDFTISTNNNTAGYKADYNGFNQQINGQLNSANSANLSGEVACFYSNSSMQPIADKSSFYDATQMLRSAEAKSKSIETGRVEQGGKSNQEFTTVNDSFNSWSSESISLKILPFSQKPIEVSELRNYCSSCGTRIKKSSWKFCPSCGTNLES